MNSKIRLTTILFCIVIGLCSCSQKYNRSISQESIAETKARPELDMSAETLGEDRSPDRKVIFNANLSLYIEHPDSANLKIETITKKYDGYINEIGTHRTVIRVKSDQLENALQDISHLGKVRNKRINGKDVTNTYLDLEIRLENAEKARDRYLQLLNKAETVAEILIVERELERLNETIDLLKGQMNRINHLDEFSTITIYLEKKRKPGLLGYVGIGLYKSVKWLFVRN